MSDNREAARGKTAIKYQRATRSCPRCNSIIDPNFGKTTAPDIAGNALKKLGHVGLREYA